MLVSGLRCAATSISTGPLPSIRNSGVLPSNAPRPGHNPSDQRHEEPDSEAVPPIAAGIGVHEVSLRIRLDRDDVVNGNEHDRRTDRELQPIETLFDHSSVEERDE